MGQCLERFLRKRCRRLPSWIILPVLAAFGAPVALEAQTSEPGLTDLSAEALVSGSGAVTLARRAEFALPGGASLIAEAATRLNLYVDRNRLILGSEPGVLLEVPGWPDFRLKELQYSLVAQEFTLRIEPISWDLFGMVARITDWTLRRLLSDRLWPLLPERLRTPGYSPFSDLDLRGSLSSLDGLLSRSGASGLAVGTDLLRDAAVSLLAVTPGDIAAPLGEGRYRLELAGGREIRIEVDTRGPFMAPRLHRLDLEAEYPGAVILPAGESGLLQHFMSLRIRRATADAHGRFQFDYSLGVEDAVDVLTTLLAMGSWALGHDPGPISPARSETLRAEIDRRLEKEAPARVLNLFQSYSRRFLDERWHAPLEGLLQDWQASPGRGISDLMDVFGGAE